VRLTFFRIGLIGSLTAVALAGWLVGGPTGAFVWVGGLLGIWGFTRLANFAMNGGFLRETDEQLLEDLDQEPEDQS
jgi:hypothetical protein